MAGKGAAHKGGRWNGPGGHVAYAAISISLAAWETRAHLSRSSAQLPFNRLLVRVDVPDDVWARHTQLPRPLPWAGTPFPKARCPRSIGSAWLAAGTSALLVVPSVIIEEEGNVLINSTHPDARELVPEKVRRFLYDHRV